MAADFWQWLTASGSALNFFVNLGLLVIWGTYLHLILQQYKQDRRCKMLISLAGQGDLRSRCLISNMSVKPVYIERVAVAFVNNEGEKVDSAVTDFETGDQDSGSYSPKEKTRQGPLHSGEWRDLGSISNLAKSVWNVGDEHQVTEKIGLLGDADPPSEFEITVVALYDTEDLPVGARRRFALGKGDKACCIWPLSVQTEQIRGSHDRAQLPEI
jgi:hypothetical protein